MIAFVPYIKSVLDGRARPSRATWIIWTILGLIMAGSYHASGAVDTIYVPIGYAIGPFIIAALAMRQGEGGWSGLDKACLAGAGVGLAAWTLTSDPHLALLAAIATDAMGAIPTIRKTYEEPGSEDRLAWLLFLAANSLNMLALGPWDPWIWTYPIYMLSLSALMVGLLLSRR